jgi:A/G-specific adenine glycosylase
MARIPNKLLSPLLLSPVLPYNKNTKMHKNGTLQIKELHSAGDVVHVFSHIKKTYRTQWVVLEGGEHPPSFTRGVTEQPGKYEERPNTEKLMDDGLSASLSSLGLVWTKLEDVLNAKYVVCQCHF